jgi:hypothetical protein
MSRRGFLRVAGAACTLPAVGFLKRDSAAAANTELRWSDPHTWNGKTPAAGDLAVISRPVVLDRDARVAGMVIEKGGELIFDRSKSVRLTSSRNILVRGRLVMRPHDHKIKHRLVFDGVKEGDFVGGGMDPIDSDVGLWVIESGKLKIVGAKKRDWTRVVGHVASGATDITLGAHPSGWRRGDEIVIAPTDTAADRDHFERFDGATVQAINDKTITLSTPTSFAHPEVQGDKQVFRAEVLNLTRNVVIQGTPGGRAHIFIRSSKPQKIKNCVIRHMGPRKKGEKVLGRWPLHFHHSHNGSRGSLVEGVVARDAGSHAFVTHVSHGIKVRNCIAYDVLETPFWWDEKIEDASDDILWDHCVAGLVGVEQGSESAFRVSGYALRSGKGNVCRGCVAIGVRGIDKAAGFFWPQPQAGVWTFNNALSHNNKFMGGFAWENDSDPHTIDGFTAYHNGSNGIDHGAYINCFRYKNLELIENGFEMHARSREGKDGKPLTMSTSIIRGAPVGLLISGSVVPGKAPALIADCAFRECEKPVQVNHKNNNPGDYNFNGCTVDGRALARSDFTFTSVAEGSTVRIDGQQIYP